MQKQRGFGIGSVVVFFVKEFSPGGREVPELSQQDQGITECGVEPLEDTQRFFEVEQRFAAAVTGEDDDVAETLQDK